MCGIVGYIGEREASPIILKGLKHLEYRGYDSAGIASIYRGKIHIRRCAGKVLDLENIILQKPLMGEIALGHTRWATHGKPSEENTHPHTDCKKELVIVHNGIIENYLSLRDSLIKEGHVFKSETDSEVIVHLIEKYLNGNLEIAVRTALKKVKGSYAIGVIWKKDKDNLIAARSGSPLIIGLKNNESFIASDVPAILSETRNIVYLGDSEIATIGRKRIKVKTLDGKPVRTKVVKISWDRESAEKGGYPHFMLKEIFQQPIALEETIRGKISQSGTDVHLGEGIRLTKRQIKSINRIIIIGCGTSWHAGLIGEYMIEELTRIPTEVEYAAEFRYRHPIIDDKSLIIAISQSGETADTLGAIREVRERGGKVISICNVVGSSIVRESDSVIYTHAGPEIGVASTKAFTTQLVILYLLALSFGRIIGNVSFKSAKEMIGSLMELPQKIRRLLEDEKKIASLARHFYRSNNFLYLGRGEGFPLALEGALKLKEVSYIHAEGYPAAEMKHGPIALIDKNMPIVVIALRGRRYEKILANIEEVKARDGVVIALASEGDYEIAKKVDHTIYIPPTIALLTPILAVIPLQLLAYHIAIKRKCPVDQPRNLAKSVTVE